MEPSIRIIQQPNGGAKSPEKGLSAAEVLKRRNAINAGQPIPGAPQRPEDKPDSPEYKKKQAMLTGPILEMTYENASSYGMPESTFTALKDIFMALITTQASRTGVLSPQRFLEIFKRDNELFRTAMHQDAHEFYGLILNDVIESVEQFSMKMPELPPPTDEQGMLAGMQKSLSNAAHAMGLTNGQTPSSAGWVHDIFEGVLTSETKCLTCETASQRDETFLDLSIDLEQNSSVTSCLRKFSAEEMLCERNKFHCDNCGGLQEAEKRMKIKKLPKILTLHLKRFKYTEDLSRLQKLFHRVVYPYQLRMFNTTDDAADPDRMYELYAVVVHIGANAYHGHYVSIIKTPDRGWLLFDDEMVKPVDKHYVRNFYGDKPGQACAYVLFYQETTLEKVQKEQEAEGLAEVSLATQLEELAAGNIPPNGTYLNSNSKRVSVPSTPNDEVDAFASLGHAVTAPLSPATPTGSRPLTHMLTSPTIPQLSSAKMKSKTKEEKEREKRENKEAEKARKVAMKEQLKAESIRRKENEAKRIQYQKDQAEQMRAVMEASKATAAEEEERRKREAAAAPNDASTMSASQSGLSDLPTIPEKNGMGRSLRLSRSGPGRKSMSRRSFFGLNKEKSAENGASNGDIAVEGGDGPPTPEKHEKGDKSRFSFSLGRKKSNLF